MPLEEDFLAKLRDPKTHSRLRYASADELARLNAAIASGRARNLAGESISEPLAEGLVPQNEAIVYPVRDGLPMMLAEAAIPLSEPDSQTKNP